MNIFFIVLALIFILSILNSVRKGKFSIVESFFWVCAGIITLILAIFPGIIMWLAEKVGVEYAPSLLFMLSILFLMLINIRNTRKIAEQQEKIICLAQDIAILKNKINSK